MKRENRRESLEKPGFIESSQARILFASEDGEETKHWLDLLPGLEGTSILRASYADAAAILERERFALVVVSQGGPAFKGRGVLERANQLRLSTPLVVVSHTVDMSSYVRAMELGAVDYFDYSTKPKLLLGVLDAYLEKQQAA